ncbi:MAG: MFS transporter [Chloroflexi bacterium]|nr:MFS transporter [Chloroflexota bacterium]
MRIVRDTPLANRDYVLFLLGAFVSSLGSWMQTVALSWTALQLSHSSSFVLGLLGFVSTAPVLFLGVWAGEIADRRNRRHILITTQTFALLLAGILTVLQYSQHQTVFTILLIATLAGAVNAINGPSWQAFIKELVGPAQLRRAIAINSARFNLTRIFGPALGGWILVTSGAGACFAFNAISFIAVVIALLIVHGHYLSPPRPSRGQLGDLLAVTKNQEIRGALIPAIGLSVLALPYNSFLPQMATLFGQGAAGLSMLLTATGIGAVLGAALSGTTTVAHHPRQALGALQILAGLALAAFAWSHNFLIALFCLTIFGAAIIGFLAVAGATIQLAAAPGTEGRALGLWMIVNSGFVPFGSLAEGAAAEAIRIDNALGIAGVGNFICGIIAAYYFHSMRKTSRTAWSPKNVED